MTIWFSSAPSGVPASGGAGGCYRGEDHVITWCIGHLVELEERLAAGQGCQRRPSRRAQKTSAVEPPVDRAFFVIHRRQ